jgi:hypothetical protein
MVYTVFIMRNMRESSTDSDDTTKKRCRQTRTFEIMAELMKRGHRVT